MNWTLGELHFTILVNDTSGNINSDTIIITVIDETDPEIIELDSDFSIYQGEESSFSWKIIENNPGYYEIYRNGTLVKSATHYDNDTLITYDFLNWTLGKLNFTILVNDTSGNIASEMIIITILERIDEYIFISPGISTKIDLIEEKGIYLTILSDELSYLNVTSSSNKYAGIDDIPKGYIIVNYYSIRCFNSTFDLNSTMIQSLTIRFYFDLDDVKHLDDLQVFHYKNGDWIKEKVVLNQTHHFVEITITELSYFCFVEYIEQQSGGDDDEGDDSVDGEQDPIIIIIIIIVIGSVAGVSSSAAYITTKKRKTAKKSHEKLFEGINAKALEPKESFEFETEVKPKAPIKTKLAQQTPKVPPQKENITKYAGPLALPKKKKKKELEKPQLTPEERKNIELENKETEKEMEIKPEVDLCQVHRGPMTGITYICPKCGAKYCLKCATALSGRDEACWVCNSPIEIGSKTADRKVADEKLINTYENIRLTKVINDENVINALRELKDTSITALSEDFIEIVEQFEWDRDEKEEFIKEMLTLRPGEREEIIDKMIENSLNENL